MKKGIKKLNKTTWKHDKVIDGDSFDTEIGDSKQPDFKPQIKIKRWDNECNFSLRLKEDNTETPQIVEIDNKIEYRKKDYKARVYEKENGFEFEVEFDKKPKSNVVEFTIDTKGLDFFYQPELTQKEIDEGAERPDNVIGSLAVYHETKKNHIVGQTNYKNGKAFHIYKPKIIDKNGDWVWGKLVIDKEKGLLKVIIPQEFLNRAVYPIIVDPTFGYTTGGASSGYIVTTHTVIFDNATGVAGTGDSMSAYMDPSTTGINTQMKLYDSSLNEVANGETVENTNTNGALHWETQIFGTSPTLTNQTYHLAVWCDGSGPPMGGYVYIRYDTDSGNDGWSDYGSYNTWAASLTKSVTKSDIIYSIYTTYTEGGGGADISKINAIATADISKVSGVAKASINKINDLTI